MSALLQFVETIRREFLPFALPSIGEDEIAEVVDTLRSGWVTTGPKVKIFENDFRKYVDAGFAIAVNSCTAGLHTALAALGIGPGDEVIVPTLTFCSTANVVVHLGARPVLVDVGPDSQIYPSSIEASITSRTRAIMPVHFAGQACDIDHVYEIAARHDLAVVEDAAHAVGSTYKGLKIGADELSSHYPTLRRATIFSFYATKNMTTGEGGMIVASDEEFAQTMRTLALHGMTRDAWKRYTTSGAWYYEVVAAGFKNNMTDIAAALGIHQLRRLDGFIKARQQIAQMYNEAFASSDLVSIPVIHANRSHAYHLYTLRLDLAHLKIDRGQFIEKLKSLNIGSSVHFIPLHLHPFYQSQFGYRRLDLAQAEKIYDCIVSLPLYPSMSEQDAQDVIDAVLHILSVNRR